MGRFAFLTFLLLACRAPTEGIGAGELEVTWQGSDGGVLRGPAVATYCEETRLLELITAVGDTGAGFVLYPSGDAVTAGRYAIFSPAEGSEQRPGANAAVRWFDVTRLDVFEGVGGELVVEQASEDRLTGTISVSMRSIVGVDTLVLAGRFLDVAIDSGGADCGARNRRRRSTPVG